MSFSRGTFRRPDWVILGVPADDGVCVYASRELTHAEIEVQTGLRPLRPDEPGHSWSCVQSVPTVTTYGIGATMRRLHVAQGATYTEAVAALFDSWSPDNEPDRLELPPAALPMEQGAG